MRKVNPEDKTTRKTDPNQEAINRKASKNHLINEVLKKDKTKTDIEDDVLLALEGASDKFERLEIIGLGILRALKPK